MIQKILFLSLLQVFCGITVFAQVWQNLEVKGGLLYAQQKLEIQNSTWETRPETGWQTGITKTIPVYKVLKWEVGLGYSEYRASAYKVVMNGTKSEKSLTFGYTFLETGMNVSPEPGWFTPYFGASFRMAGLTDSNLDKSFPLFLYNRLDYGINVKAGIRFKKGPFEPFLETGIYKGFANGATNDIFVFNPDGTRVRVKDELKQRFFSLQLGLKF